jgi:glutathione S-transferase
MLKLCGFSASNYHNKVKLALLEKGVPFDDVLVWTDETDRAASPLGKVPYLEARYPAHPLLPATPFAAAKVRELVRFLELHLELVARNLYPEAFFGGKVSETAKERVGKQLEKNVAAFAKLVKFSPFIAGDSFSLADCAATVHLPVVSGATKIIYGRDFLADLPVRDYLKRMGERPTVQQVNADRKTNTDLMMQRIKAAAVAAAQAKG